MDSELKDILLNNAQFQGQICADIKNIKEGILRIETSNSEQHKRFFEDIDLIEKKQISDKAKLMKEITSVETKAEGKTRTSAITGGAGGGIVAGFVKALEAFFGTGS